MWGQWGRRALGCLVVGVLLLTGLGASADEARPVATQQPGLRAEQRPPALGVQFHGTWNMYYQDGNSAEPLPMFWQQLDSLVQLGVRVLRVDIGWSISQPRPEPPSMGHYYNRRIELVLNEALARGMNVLLTLYQTPHWAWSDSTGTEKQYPADPAAITPWAQWMAEQFGPRVLAWEAWNEPNLEQFSGVAKTEERAARYTPILRAIATGVRAGDPHAKVVFGAPSYNDEAFIRQVYANGGRDYFDVMAVHPYQSDQTVPPETDDADAIGRVTHFDEVVQVMAENNDSYKPVWWTELGYSVHDNKNVPQNQPWLKGVASPEISAEYMRRTFEVARVRFPHVRLAIVYTAYKEASDPYGHQAGYSVLKADGTPLPQLPAIGTYLAGYGATRPLA